MRTIFRVAIGFAVVAFLLLLVLSYLEGRDGLSTSPTAVLEEIKDVGKETGEKVSHFIEESGIKDGAADLLEQGASLLRGENEDGESSPSPSPSPSPTP